MNVLALLQQYGIHPKKGLGQNFLIAIPTLEKLVRHLNPLSDDLVLEIGPGPGIMTKMLTERAKFVAAIETDRAMIAILEKEYGNIPNLHIIHGDILDTNLEKLLGAQKGWLFMGNIPYNITSPILFHLRKFREFLRYGILLMQKEVAHRIIAKPGTKDYGILSIALQAIARVEECFDVSPSSFYPEPKVVSTALKISFEDKPKYKIDDLDFFTNVVRAAFSTRRKKLKNALIQSSRLNVPNNEIVDAIAKVGISENSRAEELDIGTFIKLTNALKSPC